MSFLILSKDSRMSQLNSQEKLKRERKKVKLIVVIVSFNNKCNSNMGYLIINRT